MITQASAALPASAESLMRKLPYVVPGYLRSQMSVVPRAPAPMTSARAPVTKQPPRYGPEKVLCGAMSPASDLQAENVTFTFAGKFVSFATVTGGYALAVSVASNAKPNDPISASKRNPRPKDVFNSCSPCE